MECKLDYSYFVNFFESISLLMCHLSKINHRAEDHINMRHKVGRVFPMVVVSIPPHAEFGRNGHREDAPIFII